MLTETYIGLPNNFIFNNKIGIFSNLSYLHFEVEEKDDTIIMKITEGNNTHKIDVKQNFMINISEKCKNIKGVTFLSNLNLKVNLVKNRNYRVNGERNYDLNYVFAIYHRGIDTRNPSKINRDRSREMRRNKVRETRSRSRGECNREMRRNRSRSYERQCYENNSPRQYYENNYQNYNCQNDGLGIINFHSNYQDNNYQNYNYENNSPKTTNYQNDGLRMNYESNYQNNNVNDGFYDSYNVRRTPRILYDPNFVMLPPNQSHIPVNNSNLFR